ncbi:MAG: TIGR04282 family arsenosugar biosynthesis glycosyltransferase [Desulfococcaceae bacterium]
MTTDARSRSGNSEILVFAKSPRRGRVKTRLARTMGEEAALLLYRAFVADLLDALSDAAGRVAIFHHPADAEAAMREWLGDRWTYRPQRGADLGDRMANALADSFAGGADRAMVVGGDLPDLPKSVVSAAFRGIETNGAVLGPARDGGYYLIGFSASAFQPAVFRDIPWGAESVYRRTLARMAESGLTPAALPVWNDVDTEADLATLNGDAAPRTRALLAALKGGVELAGETG